MSLGSDSETPAPCLGAPRPAGCVIRLKTRPISQAKSVILVFWGPVFLCDEIVPSVLLSFFSKIICS